MRKLIMAAVVACALVGGAKAEHVNLWPLYYSDGSTASIAWPLVSYKDGDDWRVGTIYRDGSDCGVFPFYMDFGSSVVVTPFVFAKDWSGGAILPLAYADFKGDDTFWTVFPAVYSHRWKDGENSTFWAAAGLAGRTTCATTRSATGSFRSTGGTRTSSGRSRGRADTTRTERSLAGSRFRSCRGAGATRFTSRQSPEIRNTPTGLRRSTTGTTRALSARSSAGRRNPRRGYSRSTTGTRMHSCRFRSTTGTARTSSRFRMRARSTPISSCADSPDAAAGRR